MKTIFIFLALGCVALTAFAQGSLTPPGPPAPTMKSLGQIEPRIDVLSLPGDGSYQHVISAAGSYYLSGSITNPGILGGIHITASGVTLDLNGFAVDGAGATGSGQNGIVCGGGVSIRNGIVQNWNNFGVLAAGDGDTFEKIKFVGNAADGWNYTGNHYLVSECQSLNNNNGFNANGGPGVFNNCYAGGNVSSGFSVSSVSLQNCSASGNQGNGFVLANSVLTGASAISNSVAGISSSDSSIIDCVANSNTGDGISCRSHCQVRGNTCNNNGANGIECDAHNNRVDSNQCMKNVLYGIKTLDDPNGGIIVRNTCQLNTGTASSNATANYSPKNATNTNPYFGAIVVVSTGTPSPWANF
jgi:hypothetical protein